MPIRHILVFLAALLVGAAFTFDGAPAAPMPFADHPEYANYDVQVHSRDLNTWDDDALETMEAGHGANCSGPPATHPNSSYRSAVYVCNHHLMTAINAGGYGVIYLTPNRLLDWSNGPATLSFDVSTTKTSWRDWWDVWLQSFDGNVALPLEHWLPDLQSRGTDGSALDGREFLHIDNNGNGTGFISSNHSGVVIDRRGLQYGADSLQRRDRFELTIDRETFSFCKPDEGICWANNLPHGLTITQATVQIGHHSYNPTKDGRDGPPNTWHWDNISLEPSVPFTLIKADARRLTGTGGTVRFNAPAPEGSYLRFSAVGQVRVDGQPVSPQIVTTHPEAHNSYYVPVAAGTREVHISLSQDGWYRGPFQSKDFSLWSRNPPAPSPTPTSTPSPVPTSTASPVPSPTATATIPPATSTPVPTATVVPATPTAIATATPRPPSCGVTYDRDGVAQWRVEVPC